MARTTTPSSARLEHVRAAFPVFAARQVDALEQLMTPDVAIRIAPAAPAGKPELMRRRSYDGRAGLREWLREVDEDYSRLSLEGRFFEETGDAVLVLGTLVYESGAGGGGMTLGWVCRFDGELISRIDTYWDWSQARAAFASRAALPPL